MQFQKHFDKSLNYNKISDNKRQQTTAVDYKRLINGFVLVGFASLQQKNKENMNNKKYKQTVVPNVETPQEWKELKLQHLRTIIFNHIKTNYSGKTIINLDTRLPIIVSVTSARKTAFGEAIYFKKAAAVLILPDLIKYAEYNNWGNPKPTDGPHIIGYLNFKCKCVIDGQKENIRLAVQFQKGGKYYYNIEINKKKPTPERSNA